MKHQVFDSTAKHMMDDRVFYLDLVKIVSMFFVVLIHMFSFVLTTGQYSVGSNYWMFANIVDSLARPSVPLFVMVSGALFLDPNKKIETNSIWRRRIPKLVIAYIIWSMVYSVLHYLNGSISDVRELLLFFLTGERHLWFVFMIIGLYALIPPLRCIARDIQLCAYTSLILLAFSCLRMTSPLFPVGTFARTVLDSWMSDLSLFPGYIGLFLLGSCLSRIRIRRMALMGALLGWISSFAFTVIATWRFSLASNYFVGTFYEFLFPGVVLSSVCLFVLFTGLEYRKDSIRDNWKKIACSIANLSLGVYFAHELFVQLIGRRFFSQSGFTLLVGSFVVFAITLLIVVAIRKIPKLGTIIF